MEEHWTFSNDKLVLAEEGLKPEIRKNVKQEKIYFCEQFIHILKSILYFQLICFVAWGGYTFWQAYNQHENIHFYIFYLNSSSSSEGESFKVLNESSFKTLFLNNVEETLETTTTTNIPLERDILSNKILPNDDQIVTTMKILDSSSDKDNIFIMNPEEKIVINPFENTSTYKPIKDSSELQIDDYKNKVKDTVSSSKIIENKDKENSVDQAVFDWNIPLFSTIYMDQSSIEDSSKETYNSEPDAVVKQVFREDKDYNEDSDFHSDEYDLGSEEIKLQKDISSTVVLLDALLKDLSDNYSSHISDDFLETTESSRMDEKSENWNPDIVVSDILKNWKQDSTGASTFISEEDSEEKTKSSLFHDRLIEKEQEEEEEDPYDHLEGNHGHGYFDLTTLSFVKSVESEKSDTSKVEDDATSDSKSEFWERSSPTMSSTLDWRMQDSSIETSKTEEESTERNISTEMSTMSNIEEILSNFPLWDRDNVNHSIFSSTENVDSEKEIERIEQNQENYTCIEDIIDSIKVLKCSFTSFQPTNQEPDLEQDFKESNDRSSFIPFSVRSTEGDDESAQNTHVFIDPRDAINYNSNEMKSPDEYVDTNYSIIDQEPIKESMDFTNSESGKSDIITERWTKINPSTDAYSQENSYQDTEDVIRWWIDLSRYRETKPMFGD